MFLLRFFFSFKWNSFGFEVCHWKTYPNALYARCVIWVGGKWYFVDLENVQVSMLVWAINSIRQRQTKNSNAKEIQQATIRVILFLHFMYTKTHTQKVVQQFEFYICRTRRERTFKQKRIDSCKIKRNNVMLKTLKMCYQGSKLYRYKLFWFNIWTPPKSHNHTCMAIIATDIDVDDDDDGQSQWEIRVCVCVCAY